MRRAIITVAAVLIGNTACMGTEVGNYDPVSLDLTTYSSSPDGVAVGPTPSTAPVKVREVWVSIERVRFRAATTCDDPNPRTDIEGPIVAELVSGLSMGLPGAIDLAAGRYCRLETTFRRSDTAGGGIPAELDGHSILVRGQRADGVPFVIASRRTDEARLRARDTQGFPIDMSTGRLFLAVDVAGWLAGIDLEASEIIDEGSGPIIRIDDASNADLLAAFEGNVASVMDLFRDDNSDGVLGVDERADGRSLATGGP